MRAVPGQAVHQFGVFTVDQALATGWTLRALRHWTASGALVRLRRGAYAAASDAPPGPALERRLVGQRGVAAALRIPSATVSHQSAIAVHDLPLLEPPELPCITLAPPLRTRPAALHVHRQPIPPGQLDRSSDIALTGVARSCLDLARECGLAAGVVAADAALRRRLCTESDLADVYAESCRGRAGLAEGRTLLTSLDAKAESPLESLSRLAMRGMPAPRTQVSIYSSTGAFLARVDFYWDGWGLVGEADGREKYTDEQLWLEKQRQERLTDHGLVVERWTWSLARRPAILRQKLEQAGRRAAGLRCAGVPVTAIVRPETT